MDRYPFPTAVNFGLAINISLTAAKYILCSSNWLNFPDLLPRRIAIRRTTAPGDYANNTSSLYDRDAILNAECTFHDESAVNGGEKKKGDTQQRRVQLWMQFSLRAFYSLLQKKMQLHFSHSNFDENQSEIESESATRAPPFLLTSNTT